MATTERKARLHQEYPWEFLREDDTEQASRAPDPRAADSLPDVDVDIIAVQGLASKYERTWSVEVDPNTYERYHWLREKLPQDLKNNDIHANIYAFEYPSAWYDRNPDFTSLEECGKQLLRCIIRSRCHRGSRRMCPGVRQRPILFIGHSFGGLVVKQALLLASELYKATSEAKGPNDDASNMQDFITSVSGILFLGTPHRGSALSWLARQRMALATMMGTSSSPELISVLEEDSLLLRYIQSSFSRLRRSPELRGVQVYCFFEKKQVAFPPQRVVEEHSACLDDAESIGLDANHMQLNKYGSEPDSNYDLVYHAIETACKAAGTIVSPRMSTRVYNASGASAELQEMRRRLAPSTQQHLQFDRKFLAHKQNSTTCQWLLDQSFFDAWKSIDSETSRALWFTGKPGSGKSVLASFVINHLREWIKTAMEAENHDEQWTHIHENEGEAQEGENEEEEETSAQPTCLACAKGDSSGSILYFFGGIDRTHESPENILGTLIDQLLLANKENEALAMLAQQITRRWISSPTVDDLITMLKKLAREVGKIYIIIDAVDELPEAAEILKTLGRLSRLFPIHLLLFSQSTRILRGFEEAPFKSIDYRTITDFTAMDIDKVVWTCTNEIVNAKPELKSSEGFIAASLAEKANGMFLWIKTTADGLVESATSENLSDLIEDLPSELADGWETVFSRLGRSVLNKQTIKNTLMWIYVAPSPLSATELFYALRPPAEYANIRELAESEPRKIIENDDAHAENMHNLLVPLVEISRSSNSLHYVQLAHNSLRVALTSGSGTGTSSVRSWIGFSAQEAHTRAALTCMDICSKSTYAIANTFGTQPLFMVQYAWKHWAYHLRLSEKDFSDPKIADAFEKMIISVSRDIGSLLYALSDFAVTPEPRTSWSDDELARLVCFQRAQESLADASDAVTILRRGLPATANLQLSRETYLKYMNIGNTDHSEKIGTRLFGAARAIKDRFTGRKSKVMKCKAEEHIDETAAARWSTQNTSKQLWAAMKALRSVTLRFSVNPIHTNLMVSAASKQFSPINALVLVASLFEQAGNFPWWSEPSLHADDALTAFVTAENDPQHGPAGFVLHCMVNQYSLHDQADSDTSKNSTTASFLPFQPDQRLAAKDFAISETHKALVKKVHAMPYTTYLVTVGRIHTFQPSDGWLKSFVTNPLANHHLRNDMLLPTNAVFEDPLQTLMANAPEVTDEDYFAAVFGAVPQFYLTQLVEYVIMIFEKFGGVSRVVLSVQFMRLQNARTQAYNLLMTMKLCIDKDSATDLTHIVAGILLYLVRCYTLPWIGTALRFMKWSDFLYSFSHPAQYLEVLVHDAPSWWSLTPYIGYGRYILHEFISNTATITGATMAATKIYPKVASTLIIIGIAGQLCSFEEALYGALSACSTAVATGSLMFRDVNQLEDVIFSSFNFWVYSTVGIFFGTTINLLARLGVAGLVAALVFYIGGIWFLIWILPKMRIPEKILWLMWPVLKPLQVCLHFMMKNHQPLMHVGLTLAFVIGLFRVFVMASGWISDPYHTKTSISRLAASASALRSTVETSAIKQIGHSPFGGELKSSAEQEKDRQRLAAMRLTAGPPKDANEAPPVAVQPLPTAAARPGEVSGTTARTPAPLPPPPRRAAATTAGTAASTTTAVATTGSATPSAAAAALGPLPTPEALWEQLSVGEREAYTTLAFKTFGNNRYPHALALLKLSVVQMVERAANTPGPEEPRVVNARRLLVGFDKHLADPRLPADEETQLMKDVLKLIYRDAIVEGDDGHQKTE